MRLVHRCVCRLSVSLFGVAAAPHRRYICMKPCHLDQTVAGALPFAWGRRLTSQTHFKEQHLTEHVKTCPGGAWVSASLGVFMFYPRDPPIVVHFLCRGKISTWRPKCAIPSLHPHHGTFPHKWLAMGNYTIRTIFRIYLSGWSNSPLKWH